MIDKNNIMTVSIIKGQQEMYIYNILHNINKLKILLVFINKGFSWHRELRSLGIYNNIINETLTEFNNLGFIDLKELLELNNIQYETLTGVKQYIQHYYKIYFTNPIIYKVLQQYNNDIENIINSNPQLNDFINTINNKLKPFVLKQQQIIKEETTQLKRKVIINNIEFEKDTIMKKELIKELKLLNNNNKNYNIVKTQKTPLMLMTHNERRKHLNKVYYNGIETNNYIFNELKENNKKAEFDYKNGTIGKSIIQLDIERAKQDKYILDRLGI